MKKQLLFLLMLMPLMASAAPVEIDSIWYNLNTIARVAEVTKGTTKYTGDIVIPASIKYEDVTYSVTSIGSNAFYYSSLTSVTIPNSVTIIGDQTFIGCTNLTSVTIPNSVTTIKHAAFQGCTSLTSVTIGNSVTIIGNQAFKGCTSLTSVTIGNNVTTIGNLAFDGCNNLTSITIPNNVTSIGGSAFANCI